MKALFKMYMYSVWLAVLCGVGKGEEQLIQRLPSEINNQNRNGNKIFGSQYDISVVVCANF